MASTRPRLPALWLGAAAPITVVLSAGFPLAAARAQAAAETAIILGASGAAQGRAQRALGGSIAAGMGNAANAIAATGTARRGGATTYRQPPRQRAGGGHFAIALPADVDPLERTGAPTYTLGNGRSIRVSGGLRRPPPVSDGELQKP